MHRVESIVIDVSTSWIGKQLDEISASRWGRRPVYSVPAGAGPASLPFLYNVGEGWSKARHCRPIFRR